MSVQAEYVADPTPENLAKMQQEMASLSQKMAQLSAQLTAAVTAAVESSNLALSDDDEDDDDDGDDYDDDEDDDEDDDDYDDEDIDAELMQFILDNPVPPGKEKYLPIGALLISAHGELWQTLAMMSESIFWMSTLENEGWGIKNIEDGKRTLDYLLDGQHTAAFEEDFRKFKAGQPHNLEKVRIDAYHATLACLDEDFPSLLSVVKKCDSILAWDLERAGYLTRVFYLLGWVDETEIFDLLEKIAKKIKANFPSWEKYTASIIAGRAIAYGFDDELVVLIAYEILAEGKEFLDAHPVSRL
jgi:hypothetical protein